jgi:polygalacturonase
VEEGSVCGAGDPELDGMEPSFPSEVCATLVADHFATDMSPPSEDTLDTERIQKALNDCAGKAVKLVAEGTNNAFVSGHLNLIGTTLWIDRGVTLYMSRNPLLFQRTGSCGLSGINDSTACGDFITVSGQKPAIMGDGVIDGQGGEPLIGHPYSWWQLSYALREVDGSLGNPTLINLANGTAGFVLYRITLHNSAKFHVKISSILPTGEVCDRRGRGFIVWGVTVLTPSKWTNSQGLVLTPSFARNTDGIDPGTTAFSRCGLMACNTISTGDDHIAIKGGHGVTDLTIAHNHFGTGHGMSIGSETYGLPYMLDGVLHQGIENVDIRDLTIDADSRPVGTEAISADFNGLRIKSDSSRGGVVRNITYTDVCMRDMTNAILISTAYNPLFAGTLYPQFGAISFNNIRHVSCKGLHQPVVTLNGFNSALPAGPITMNNVHVDNMGPQAVSGQYSNIVLGPGPVNFEPKGIGVTVTDTRDGAGEPRKCVFPTLPAPQPPAGWTR